MVPTSFTVGPGSSTPVVVLLRKYWTGYIGCPPFYLFIIIVSPSSWTWQVPFFVKCWARYLEHLLFARDPRPCIWNYLWGIWTICKAFKTICEVDPGSCVKRYLFIFSFVLAQISSLNSVQTWTLQYLGLKGWRKKDFIELKYDYHLRNIGKVIKDSKDHRVSFYHGFLNKIT